MDDAQKRLEARKARLDEARKKRVNNLKRGPSGDGSDGSSSSPRGSPLSSSSSASAVLSTPSSSFSRPPPSSASPTASPQTNPSSRPSFSPSTAAASSPTPGRTTAGAVPSPNHSSRPSGAATTAGGAPLSPGGIQRPSAAAAARGTPSPAGLGSSSSFSSPSTTVGAAASSSSSGGAPPRNGFAKPLPPSARGRAGGAGSPFGSPSPSPPLLRRTESAGFAAASAPIASPVQARSPLTPGRLGSVPADAQPPPRSPALSSTAAPSSPITSSAPPRTGPLVGGVSAHLPASPSVNRAYGSPILPQHNSTSPSGLRTGGLSQSTPGDELRRKREEDERRRKEAEEEIRRRAQEEQEQKRKEEERRSQEEEADRKRQAEAKESAETTNDTSEEQAEKEAKRLHYVGMFVEMQKKEREQTKAQREAAKEARQLRANEKQANTGPGIAQALPQPSSPSSPTHARPSLPSKLPQQPSPNSPPPQRAAAVEESTAAQQESDMDREIEIIIEIGRLKEEVDSYKRRCKEEEAKVAELKRKIQRRDEAQAEAQRKRGWLSSSSSSSGGSVIKDRNPAVSVYQNKDITKRPLVGGARFFSVYTPAGGGSPIDGYDPSLEERTRSPSLPQASPPPAQAPPTSPPPVPLKPSAVQEEKADASLSDSGRAKLKRSKSGKILRSFLSTYIPSAGSSSPGSPGSSLASSGEKATRLGSSASSFDESPLSSPKGSLIKKREMRKSFSLEAGLIRKKKDVSSDHDAISSDEKKKDKERIKREKKEKKEKEKKEKELKKKRGGKTVTVFNSTLEEVMSLQEESDGEVPVILKTLTDAIFSLNGHRCEGIFRLSPSVAELSKLKDQFNEQNYELTTTDPHVVASCLKLWFRELSQPLIPHDFYDECIKKAHHMEQITQLITRIPPINQKVIEFFARFLLRVADEDNVRVTKMGLDNLAIVFSPGFLRCLDPMKMMANSALEGLFVENLIEVYK